MITVRPDTKISRVEEVLLDNNLSMVPVSSEGNIIGTISIHDILKLKPHNFNHLPVRRYMARHFHEKVNKSSLRYMYGNSLIKVKEKKFNINNKLNNLSVKYKNIIKNIASIINNKNYRVYLVGGMVRDIIIKRDNKDLDFVIDGMIKAKNFKDILTSVSENFNGSCKYNNEFMTGNVQLKSGINLDFAAARREYYYQPGSLPKVKASNLKEDIWRRDFTVNSLYLDINAETRGNVYDYINGKKDLDKKLIRTLHCFSFLDDPSRIIRGIKQALELNFTIEEETLKLMNDALKHGVFPGLTSGRIVKELKMLFSNKVNRKFISVMKKLPVFNLINIDIKLNKQLINKLLKLEEILAYFDEKNYNVNGSLLRIAVLINGNSIENISNWNLDKKEENLINFTEKEIILKKIKNTEDPVIIADILKELRLEKCIILMLENINLSKKIKYYYEELINIDLKINGNDLINLGLKPGPEIKLVLKQVWRAKANKKSMNYQEEIDYASKLIKGMERS